MNRRNFLRRLCALAVMGIPISVLFDNLGAVKEDRDWHHFVIVYDKDGIEKHYLDNELIVSCIVHNARDTVWIADDINADEITWKRVSGQYLESFYSYQ